MRISQKKQGGFIVSMELIFIATILVIGLVVGWNSVRVAVVTELADVAEATAAVNQSFYYEGVTGHHADVFGSAWDDGVDTCDLGALAQAPGANSRCVTTCDGLLNAPVPESGTPFNTGP